MYLLDFSAGTLVAQSAEEGGLASPFSVIATASTRPAATRAATSFACFTARRTSRMQRAVKDTVTAASQSALGWFSLSPTCLDGCLVERSGLQRYAVSFRQDQLQDLYRDKNENVSEMTHFGLLLRKAVRHLGVEQALDGLPIDVRNEISRAQSSLKSRARIIDGHDEVVDCIKIRVAQIDTDGP